MTKKEYKQSFDPEDFVGMDAIDDILYDLYPDQEPEFFQPLDELVAQGQAPLEGISMYKLNTPEPHLHFVSYGFSNLFYDEESASEEFSGFGFELSFRLKNIQADNTWVCGLMQNLALYVFDTNNWFEPYHIIPAGGPICLDFDTDITALAFTLDPKLGEKITPNGKVQFLQMVGITSSEYAKIEKNPSAENVKKLIDSLAQNNSLLITDLTRK